MVHLADEAKMAGPVHYRWMYPIERYNFRCVIAKIWFIVCYDIF